MTLVTEYSDSLIETPASAGLGVNTKLIEHIDVEIEAVIGTARMSVAVLSALAPEAVIALDAALNQPVELRLNRALIGRGELVAVGDSFGVRVTEIAQWPE